LHSSEIRTQIFDDHCAIAASGTPNKFYGKNLLRGQKNDAELTKKIQLFCKKILAPKKTCVNVVGGKSTPISANAQI
jgi:hypothetical protein